MSNASDTPNVVVENPAHRKRIQVVLAAAGIIVGTVIVVDGSAPQFDVTAWTGPISAGLLYLGSALGLAVTVPNIPRG